MNATLQHIIDLAKNVAPLVAKVAGTTLLGPVIGIAEGVLELGRKYKEINQMDDPAELDAHLAEVEAAVMAHANSTIESLG